MRLSWKTLTLHIAGSIVEHAKVLKKGNVWGVMAMRKLLGAKYGSVVAKMIMPHVQTAELYHSKNARNTITSLRSSSVLSLGLIVASVST